MTSRRLGFIAAIASVTLVPFCATAAPVTFSYTGTIFFVDASLTGTFAVGQTMSGSVTYESSTLDSRPANAQSGVYNGITANALVTSGGYSASSTSGQVQVSNFDNPPFNPPFDQFIAASFAASVSGGLPFSLTGADVNGLPLLDLGFTLFDPTGTALSSDALVSSLSLAAFDPTQSSIGFDFGIPVDFPQEFHAVRANFTSFVVGPVAVPEPGTLALLGGALAVLGLRVLRRGRSTM